MYKLSQFFVGAHNTFWTGINDTKGQKGTHLNLGPHYVRFVCYNLLNILMCNYDICPSYPHNVKKFIEKNVQTKM